MVKVGQVAAAVGVVKTSNRCNHCKASSAFVPHISALGRKLTQNAGRSGWPYSLQRLSAVNCTQRTPAGLPSGMPGIGELMEGAMQQAPQPTRHSIWLNSHFASAAMANAIDPSTPARSPKPGGTMYSAMRWVICGICR